MKKFVFSLQSLYDMQTGFEKQQKLKIKNIEAKLAKQSEEMDYLKREFDKAKTEYHGVITAGVMANRALKYDRFFSRLKTSMSAVQKKILKLESEKEQCMQKLVDIRKEIKMLEKIKEKEYGKYLENLKKEHARQIEDFISYKVIVS